MRQLVGVVIIVLTASSAARCRSATTGDSSVQEATGPAIHRVLRGANDRLRVELYDALTAYYNWARNPQNDAVRRPFSADDETLTLQEGVSKIQCTEAACTIDLTGPATPPSGASGFSGILYRGASLANPTGTMDANGFHSSGAEPAIGDPQGEHFVCGIRGSDISTQVFQCRFAAGGAGEAEAESEEPMRGFTCQFERQLDPDYRGLSAANPTVTFGKNSTIVRLTIGRTKLEQSPENDRCQFTLAPAGIPRTIQADCGNSDWLLTRRAGGHAELAKGASGDRWQPVASLKNCENL